MQTKRIWCWAYTGALTDLLNIYLILSWNHNVTLIAQCRLSEYDIGPILEHWLLIWTIAWFCHGTIILHGLLGTDKADMMLVPYWNADSLTVNEHGPMTGSNTGHSVLHVRNVVGNILGHGAKFWCGFPMVKRYWCHSVFHNEKIAEPHQYCSNNVLRNTDWTRITRFWNRPGTFCVCYLGKILFITPGINK